MLKQVKFQTQLQTQGKSKVHPTPSFPGLCEIERFIKFNHMLEKNGNILIDIGNGSTFIIDRWWDERIDWTEKDNPNIKAIEKLIADSIKVTGSKCKDLLKINPANWTKEQRIEWQETISHVVSDMADKISQFSEYRDRSSFERGSINSLNKEQNYVCLQMSIVEGIAIQSVENHFLKSHAKDYYLCMGSVLFEQELASPNKVENKSLLHAYIMTENGDVIEATEAKGANPYKKSIDKDFNIKRHIAGFPALVTIESVGQPSYYGSSGFDGSNKAVEVCKKRYEVLLHEDLRAMGHNALKELQNDRIPLLHVWQDIPRALRGREFAMKETCKKLLKEDMAGYSEEEQFAMSLFFAKAFLTDKKLDKYEIKSLEKLDLKLENLSFELSEDSFLVNFGNKLSAQLNVKKKSLER